MANIKQVYGSTTSGSGGITSLATSSTWTAGYEWFIIDNQTDLNIDYQVFGNIAVGTTPTINTEIRIYAVASPDGTTWPDVFDGIPSAETLTSQGVGTGFLKWCATLDVDSTTSNRVYPYHFTLSSIFTTIPAVTAFFVAHNTGVNLNSTGGNHTYNYTPVYLRVN